MAKDIMDIGTEYKYGFRDKDVSVFRAEKGLSPEIVKQISRNER